MGREDHLHPHPVLYKDNGFPSSEVVFLAISWLVQVQGRVGQGRRVMVIMFFMREGWIIKFLREVQGRKVSVSAGLVSVMGRGGEQGPVMVDDRLVFSIIIRIRLWCVRGR